MSVAVEHPVVGKKNSLHGLDNDIIIVVVIIVLVSSTTTTTTPSPLP